VSHESWVELLHHLTTFYWRKAWRLCQHKPELLYSSVIIRQQAYKSSSCSNIPLVGALDFVRLSLNFDMLLYHASYNIWTESRSDRTNIRSIIFVTPASVVRPVNESHLDFILHHSNKDVRRWEIVVVVLHVVDPSDLFEYSVADFGSSQCIGNVRWVLLGAFHSDQLVKRFKVSHVLHLNDGPAIVFDDPFVLRNSKLWRLGVQTVSPIQLAEVVVFVLSSFRKLVIFVSCQPPAESLLHDSTVKSK
jgi:hypothetical protein